ESEFSPVLTAVVMPDGHDADELRSLILDRFDMSLGAGLSKLQGKVFRIGHLGDLNDLTLAGTLSGGQMGRQRAGGKLAPGGRGAALEIPRDSRGHAPLNTTTVDSNDPAATPVSDTTGW